MTKVGYGEDSPAVVQMCLTCKRKVCKWGDCDEVRAQRREEIRQGQKGGARGRRPTLRFEWHGREWTIEELCELTGLTWNCLYQRLVKAHWPIEKAIAKPQKGKRKE